MALLNSRASIPEIIRRAGQMGILKPEDAVDRTTVYRVAKRRGLWVAHQRNSRDRDVRRFAYPHRMDMVLCDGKHFRAGATRARRVAMFFLDDATRTILHAVVGTSENALLFQRGLYVRVPGQSGQGFRAIPDSVPDEAGHDSDPIRTAFRRLRTDKELTIGTD